MCFRDTEVAIHGGIQGVLKNQAGTATFDGTRKKLKYFTDEGFKQEHDNVAIQHAKCTYAIFAFPDLLYKWSWIMNHSLASTSSGAYLLS